jgi:hypothetical protein
VSLLNLVERRAAFERKLTSQVRSIGGRGAGRRDRHAGAGQLRHLAELVGVGPVRIEPGEVVLRRVRDPGTTHRERDGEVLDERCRGLAGLGLQSSIYRSNGSD